MEVFSRGLPPSALAFFPRGPFQAPAGGFGWTAARVDGGASLHDLAPVAKALLGEVLARAAEMGAPPDAPLDVIGFSQGAAMAYTLVLTHPRRFRTLAALSGFLPNPPLDFIPPRLESLRVYIAHGRQDTTIPVEMARTAAVYMETLGAQVELCENEAGHKLPVSCFNALTRFLTSDSPSLKESHESE